jgi:hypothetical protein
MTIDMEEMYRDQAIVNSHLPGYQFFSAYTPYGIQQLDARFARRIQAWKNGEFYLERHWKVGYDYIIADTMKRIEDDINECIHLHPKIKENLLYNLKN